MKGFAMTNFTRVTLSAAAILVFAAIVYSQDFLRADHKINDGRVRSNQRHAQEQAQALYNLSHLQRPIPKDEAMELVSGIRQDLAISDKALAKLETEYRKNKEASELVESIRKHHAKVNEDCAMAEKTYTKAEGDKVV